jgi:hypothetical protein
LARTFSSTAACPSSVIMASRSAQNRLVSLNPLMTSRIISLKYIVATIVSTPIAAMT